MSLKTNKSTFEFKKDLVQTFLKNINDISGLEKVSDRLKSFLKQYDRINEQDNRLKVGVLGNFSSGKSTFINSVIGYPLMPVGDIHVKKIVSKITYGVEKKIKIIYKDEKEKEISQEEFLTKIFIEEVLKDKKVKEIRITYPSNKLTDIELIDTPGFSIVDKKMGDKISQCILEEVEVIFWISTCDGGRLRKDEINRLKSFSKEKPVIIIINKSDNKTELDRKKILDNLLSDEEIKPIIKKDDNIVFYSAKEISENNNEVVYQELIDNIKKSFIELEGCDIKLKKERKDIGKKIFKEQINYIKKIKSGLGKDKEVKCFELKDSLWLKSYERLEKLLKEIKQNKELYEKEKLENDFKTYLKRNFKTEIEEVKNKLEKNKKIAEVKREELLKYYKKVNKYYNKNFFCEYNNKFIEDIILKIIDRISDEFIITKRYLNNLWNKFTNRMLIEENKKIDFNEFLDKILEENNDSKLKNTINKMKSYINDTQNNIKNEIKMFVSYTMEFMNQNLVNNFENYKLMDIFETKNIDYDESESLWNFINPLYPIKKVWNVFQEDQEDTDYDWNETLEEYIDDLIPQENFLKKVGSIFQKNIENQESNIKEFLDEYINEISNQILIIERFLSEV
ncbi:MAG: dynamin family protein [Candidatus Muirbacterium halophilum]|nr:dynamin family protein [Candidatus Muirbacterium halophilum]